MPSRKPSSAGSTGVAAASPTLLVTGDAEEMRSSWEVLTGISWDIYIYTYNIINNIYIYV
jgi:hypothetical protein